MPPPCASDALCVCRVHPATSTAPPQHNGMCTHAHTLRLYLQLSHRLLSLKAPHLPSHAARVAVRPYLPLREPVVAGVEPQAALLHLYATLCNSCVLSRC